MSGLTAVGYFLFTLVFSFLTFLLWARIALRYFRISSLHPISQSIYKLTNPILNPLTTLFKSSHLRANRYDWVCLTLLVITELLKFTLLYLIASNTLPNLAPLIIRTIAELILEPCHLLFYAILIRVVLSWVNPYLKNPLIDVIYIITEPVLQWARHKLPSFSTIDFSPVIILIILKVITLFIETSLPSTLI